MGERSELVGGLPLPGALLEAIADGRWKPPANMETIANVFGDEPDWPQFYDLPTMSAQNRSFQQRSQADLAELIPGSDGGIGISPNRAVLIGDLGADMPIALDYRTSETEPCVIYLGPDGWREVASDFRSLSERLGL
jgi:hypothetical protein